LPDAALGPAALADAGLEGPSRLAISFARSPAAAPLLGAGLPRPERGVLGGGTPLLGARPATAAAAAAAAVEEMGLELGMPFLLPPPLREPRERPLPWLFRLSREEARELTLSVSEPSASNMLPSAMGLALLACLAAALGVPLRPCCWLPWAWCTVCHLSGVPGSGALAWLLLPACWRLLLLRWPPLVGALAGCSLRVHELCASARPGCRSRERRPWPACSWCNVSTQQQVSSLVQ
jgi:hypothetical protein